MKFRILRSPDGDGQSGGGSPNPAPTFDISKVEGDAFLNLFPTEVRGAGYMKDVKNWDGFVKKFDGAQKLLGERQFPDANATPEQWNAFFAKSGRPEKPEGYQFKLDGVDADTQKVINSPAFRSVFHSAGLSQKQAEGFVGPFVKMLADAEAADKAAEDKQYNDFMDTTFAQDRKTIEENGKKFLAANLPKEMVPLLEKMDPTSMGVMIAAIDKVVAKFGGQDTFRGKNPDGSGSSGAMTPDTIKTEMMKIMQQPEYSDPFKDKVKHRQLLSEMETLRNKLKSLS